MYQLAYKHEELMKNLAPFTELMLPCCSASGIHGMSEECSREPKSDLISLSCINLKLPGRDNPDFEAFWIHHQCSCFPEKNEGEICYRSMHLTNGATWITLNFTQLIFNWFISWEGSTLSGKKKHKHINAKVNYCLFPISVVKQVKNYSIQLEN